MGQYVRWQMAFAALNYRQKRALDHLSCYFRAVKNIFPSQVVWGNNGALEKVEPLELDFHWEEVDRLRR